MRDFFLKRFAPRPEHELLRDENFVELLPSSGDLVEQLIKRRFPKLSVIDARTAAEFSGGNARIAIALAATVGRNESLSGLADRELFQRLFQQHSALRHGRFGRAVHRRDELIQLIADAEHAHHAFGLREFRR